MAAEEFRDQAGIDVIASAGRKPDIDRYDLVGEKICGIVLGRCGGRQPSSQCQHEAGGQKTAPRRGKHGMHLVHGIAPCGSSAALVKIVQPFFSGVRAAISASG